METNTHCTLKNDSIDSEENLSIGRKLINRLITIGFKPKETNRFKIEFDEEIIDIYDIINYIETEQDVPVNIYKIEDVWYVSTSYYNVNVHDKDKETALIYFAENILYEISEHSKNEHLLYRKFKNLFFDDGFFNFNIKELYMLSKKSRSRITKQEKDLLDNKLFVLFTEDGFINPKITLKLVNRFVTEHKSRLSLSSDIVILHQILMDKWALKNDTKPIGLFKPLK